MPPTSAIFPSSVSWLFPPSSPERAHICEPHNTGPHKPGTSAASLRCDRAGLWRSRSGRMLPAPADSSQEHPGSTLTFIERRRLGFERLAGLAAYFINVWHFQWTLEVAKCCAVVHELYCSVAVPRSAGCHRVTGPLPAPNETRGPPPASSSRWLFPLLSASSKDTCFIPMGRVSHFSPSFLCPVCLSVAPLPPPLPRLISSISS